MFSLITRACARRLFLIFIVSLAPALRPAFAQQAASPAAARPKPTFADVKYGPHERNVLDFWQADAKEPAPVVVAIHGGGFMAGDKSQAANANAVAEFLRWGISFASVNYRYSTQAPYPAPMLDCARAVQFLRSK